MSDAYDLVIHARRTITADGEAARAVAVRDGLVSAVEPLDSNLAADATQVVELADDEVLLPGLVDTHVHVNDPGRTDWEGFRSATRAAAAGGVTTIVDMPLNSIPPTCSVDALEVKRKTAAGQCFVDVGFWGGAVPGNVPDLRGLHEAGVFGFKSFLLHSGVDEFPPLAPDELESAMRELASLGAMMIVHAEDAHIIDAAPAVRGGRYADFLASRPRDAEDLAITTVVELARRTGCRVHILHLSSSDAMQTIDEARADGVALTVETCPHYLTLTAEEVADGATQFKCCPPIREADNRDVLWAGLVRGTIDVVVSDHSPCTPELKLMDTGDFGAAWGGISSVQLGLPAIWTEARRRGYDLTDVVRWMSERPAAFAGLGRKGRIALGYDADFCVLAPDEVFTVDAHELFHKNAVTPYDGRRLDGRVRGTWLRGRNITADLEQDREPGGTLLDRGVA